MSFTHPDQLDAWDRAEESAAREEFDLADFCRRLCAYCGRTHAVAILVGHCPDGTECRACPEHLSRIVENRNETTRSRVSIAATVAAYERALRRAA